MSRHHPLEYLEAVIAGRKEGATPAFIARHFGLDARQACKLARQLVARGALVERMENRVIVFHAKPKDPPDA